MQYILTGFTHDVGFRVFAFECIGEDRVRTPYSVGPISPSSEDLRDSNAETTPAVPAHPGAAGRERYGTRIHVHGSCHVSTRRPRARLRQPHRRGSRRGGRPPRMRAPHGEVLRRSLVLKRRHRLTSTRWILRRRSRHSRRAVARLATAGAGDRSKGASCCRDRYGPVIDRKCSLLCIPKIVNTLDRAPPSYFTSIAVNSIFVASR